MRGRLAVFIGRFSPFHNGHAEVLRRSIFNPATKHTLVLIGSADRPATVKNPWSDADRLKMIQDWKLENHLTPVSIDKLHDYPYNDQLWLKGVHEKIKRCQDEHGIDPDLPVMIIGSDRDASTYYLKMFPKPAFELDLIEENEKVSQLLSATSIRDVYFGMALNGHKLNVSEIDRIIGALVPYQTQSFLIGFRSTDEYKRLVKEHEFLVDYKRKWSLAPFPPTFVTVDAVVVQSGHLLLIQRGREDNIGGGLYALPGGFLNQNERIEDAMIRELREETRLKVPVPVLKGSIVKKETFDKPDRSLRGRTITHAYFLHLKDMDELPEVKGDDDAEWAGWVPLAEVYKMRNKLFEDHYDIITEMVGTS